MHVTARVVLALVIAHGLGCLQGTGAGGTSDPSLAQSWEREWAQHHLRLAMAAIHDTFEPRSVEIFDRSLAGISTKNLSAEYSISEEAIHKIRQRIRARLEELVAEQVNAEQSASALSWKTP